MKIKSNKEKTNANARSLRAGGSGLISSHQTKLVAEAKALRERFLFIIEMWAADRYRYEWLENHTGIPAARWQNVLLEKQFPTLEMLIAVCKSRPDYTYWLIHGTQQKWVSDPPQPRFVLEGPSEETLNKFRTDREWIKERRKSNVVASKTSD